MNARRWMPPLFWAAVILVLTSIPGGALPELHGADKMAHFAVYGVLGFLITRAAWNGTGCWKRVLGALAVACIFAALDEWHQGFVPGRESELLDWIADVAGIMAGSAAAAAVISARARFS